MDHIDDAIAAVDREWRAYGVSRRDRLTLAADLRIDLESAGVEGLTPRELLGPDLRSFARRVVDESGVPRVRQEHVRVVRTALAGAVVGAVAGWTAMTYLYPMLGVLGPAGIRLPVQAAVLLYYGPTAALAVAGAVVAVRTRLADLPRIGQTADAMIVLMPIAGAVITPITMGLAYLLGYSTALVALVIEGALVASAIAGAVLLARLWALRQPGPAATPVSARPAA